jgi:hypothetical protein
VCEDRSAALTAKIDLRLVRDKRISELNDLFTDQRPDLYAQLWDVERTIDPAIAHRGVPLVRVQWHWLRRHETQNCAHRAGGHALRKP